MNDNDIIKAMERCNDPIFTCEGCPLERAGSCLNVIKKYALDLINRQKAEIERLQHIRAELSKENDRLYIASEENQKVIKVWKDIAHRETGYVKIARIEAIREFAKRLEADLGELFIVAHPCVPAIIDNLVKEMTEGEDET